MDDRVMTSPRHQGNSSRALLTEEQLQNFNIVLVSADMLFSVYSGKKNEAREEGALMGLRVD